MRARALQTVYIATGLICDSTARDSIGSSETQASDPYMLSCTLLRHYT